jgi:hypothetical protein
MFTQIFLVSMSISMIIYRHDQIPNRIEYKYLKSTLRERYGDYDHKATGTYHLGQLKLFMSELMFLSRMVEDGDETVVYAGAAPGHHIAMLAKMFPDNKFELWDPRRFKVELLDNIETHQDFFTDEVADSYAKRRENGEKILFISDIRDRSVVKATAIMEADEAKGMDADEQLISTDMLLQQQWCNRIKPKAAFLKFRFPWKPGTTNYYDGKIYLQPYYSIATESRLLVTDFDSRVTYDHDEYNDKIYFFHANYRFDPVEDDRWKKVMTDNNVKISWDNYIGFYTAAYYLEKQKKVENVSDQEVYNLFEKIIEDHRKMLGSKYDFVFED